MRLSRIRISQPHTLFLQWVAMTQDASIPGWQPLKGVRVLELAQIMAGPVAGLMLADLGADVVKVEKFPGGDDARGFNSQEGGGVPASFEVLNRGKRSVAINLKTEAGRSALRRLVARLDGVRSYLCGPDAGLTPAAYDFAVVGTFDDRDCFTAYRDHPEHQRILSDMILPHLDVRTVVQLEH